MTYDEYKNHFLSLHPKPARPSIWGFLFRVDLIFLILAAAGGVVFSASRTFTLIAEQSGSSIAAFAVLALEFSLAGLILSEAHRNTGWFMRAIRSSAVWIAIFLLVLILVVTNASYEIKQVGLVFSDQILKIVVVFFLGVMIPILVVINLENVATKFPVHLQEFRQAQDKYYQDLAGWTEQLEEGWNDERDKEFAEDKPMQAYAKDERRTFIKEQLDGGKKLNKSKLAQRFGVSVTTIINDISALETKEEKIESQF